MNNERFEIYIESANLLIEAMKIASNLIRIDGDIELFEIQSRYGFARSETISAESKDLGSDTYIQFVREQQRLAAQLNARLEESCLKIIECARLNLEETDITIQKYIANQLGALLGFMYKEYIRPHVGLDHVRSEVDAYRRNAMGKNGLPQFQLIDSKLEALLEYCKDATGRMPLPVG